MRGTVDENSYCIQTILLFSLPISIHRIELYAATEMDALQISETATGPHMHVNHLISAQCIIS